jgi:hypothetical protein
MGKLLRYEFKHYLRVMPLLYLISLALALVFGIHEALSPENPWSQAIVPLGGGLLTVVFVANCVIVFRRFHSNLLKDEGYLMFTLPVRLWELTASKAIAALALFLLTALTALLCCLIYISAAFGIPSVRAILSPSWELLTAGRTASLVLIAVIALVFIIEKLSCIYSIIAASQMLPRFRSFAGIAAYVVVGTIQSLITDKITSQFSDGAAAFPHLPSPSFLIPFGLAELAFAALYFWLCGWLLKRTLNLE